MLLTLILSFLAGLFASNGFPHFVKGITKEEYPCMLGNSPVHNLIGGWMAFVLAALFVNYAHMERFPIASFIASAVGVLLMGLFHAWIGAFGKDNAQPTD